MRQIRLCLIHCRRVTNPCGCIRVTPRTNLFRDLQAKMDKQADRRIRADVAASCEIVFEATQEKWRQHIASLHHEHKLAIDALLKRFGFKYVDGRYQFLNGEFPGRVSTNGKVVNGFVNNPGEITEAHSIHVCDHHIYIPQPTVIYDQCRFQYCLWERHVDAQGYRRDHRVGTQPCQRKTSFGKPTTWRHSHRVNTH